MTYAYNSKIYLAEAVLNVKNLARQTAFHTQILGLEMLSQTEDEVLLGAGGKPLVRLIQTDRTEALKASYGLYHMAILLPSREDLTDVFKHMAELNVPFVGAADHGYSEALYLEDPEGNGIELYRDKPVAEWDIREDGRIIGVTEELSAQEIYEMGSKVVPFQIASDTRMGHIHLSVRDSRAVSTFPLEIAEQCPPFTKRCWHYRISLLFHQPAGSLRVTTTITWQSMSGVASTWPNEKPSFLDLPITSSK